MNPSDQAEDHHHLPPTIQFQSSDDTVNKGLRATIFKAAMSRKWKEVLDQFRKSKQVRYEKITRNNDTVLHVTISGATQNIVSQLLDAVKRTNTRDEWHAILGAKNKRGETPLHLAAALGQEYVCHIIAGMMPEMVTEARNDDQETPLFTAVRHGRKHAFFVLEDAIKNKKPNNQRDVEQETNRHASTRDISHCRRYDGNNILHYAIKGEHFHLAYEIIHLYPELVNYVNASGESALHILANKPAVFRSGTRFGLYDTIIYYCIITEPLELKFHNFMETEEYLSPDIHSDESEMMPKTYRVCVDLFTLFKERVLKFNFFKIGSSLRAGLCKRSSDGDLEQPGSEKRVYGHETPEQRRIPQNYDVAVFFLKVIVKLLLVVLGIGLRRLQSIRKLKQKHRNAKTIMKEMVDQSKLWEYEDAGGGGMKPEHSTSQKLYDTESPPDLAATEAATSGPVENQQNPSKAHGSDIMIAAREGGKDALKKVLEKFSLEAKNLDKKDIIFMGIDEKKSMNEPNTASPVLVAAKRGITEMVTIILEKFPVAILDQDEDEKNIVLLAVEHRQVHVYKYMLNVPTMKEHIFGKVDKEGNSALHLAAMLSHSRPWSIPGAALQMQWESKWYKYVLDSVDQGTFTTINNKGETAQNIFIESHDILVKDGSSWLVNTSQSCSVVAALVATVAFASASTVPGGVDSASGFPVLIKKPAFQMFAISSLVALCFSVTSLVMFLAILTSRYQARDFNRGLPVKLILGLTSLFMSIASMLVSFCAGDFFVVEKRLKFAAYPIYAVMCFPVTFFAIAQFPLYLDLIKATIQKVPERTEKIQDY